MTHEEAMEVLDTIAYNAGGADRDKIMEACKHGVDALYRMVRRKPYRHKIEYPYLPDVTVCQCPICLRRLRTALTTRMGDKYCPDCGQAIDWEEEDGS